MKKPFDPALTNVRVRDLAPGFWLDGNGNPHISIPELLAAFEMEDTPENRKLATEMVQEITRANGLPTLLRPKSYFIPKDGLSIKCLLCGMTSHNQDDVLNLYCGHCHRFHEQ